MSRRSEPSVGGMIEGWFTLIILIIAFPFVMIWLFVKVIEIVFECLVFFLQLFALLCFAIERFFLWLRKKEIEHKERKNAKELAKIEAQIREQEGGASKDS